MFIGGGRFLATIFSLLFSTDPMPTVSAVPAVLGCMFELARIEFFTRAVCAEPGLNSLESAVTGNPLTCYVLVLFLLSLPVASLWFALEKGAGGFPALL